MNNSDLQGLPVVFSVQQVSTILAISRNTTYELIRSGRIRSIRIGRRIRIPRSALESYLDGMTNR